MRRACIKAALIYVIATMLAIGHSSAEAFNYNRSSIQGLAGSYGFVKGQKRTLLRIAREHRDLDLAVKLARMRFSSAFPNIEARLRVHLKEAFGEHFAEFERIQNRQMAELLDGQAISRDSAVGFIEMVAERAKGEIESPILEHLLAVTYEERPHNEMIDGFVQRYETDGKDKSKGIRLQVRIPRSWLQQEGERPNIVQKWTSVNGSGLEDIMLGMRDIGEEEELDLTQLEEYVRSGEVRAIAEGGEFIDAGVIIIEGRPGFWLDHSMQRKRMGTEMYIRQRMYHITFRGKAIQVACQAVDTAKHADQADQRAERIWPLCDQVANSIMLVDAY